MRLYLTMLALFCAAMAGLTGCGKSGEPQPTATPPEKGTLQTAVEGFTGKTAVDYGLKAKEQIKAASDAQARDRNEVIP